MKLFKYALAVFAATILVAYTADYLLVRYRMLRPKSGEAFGTVQMEQLYAIPQKDGKTEYEFDARQPEVTTPCVHSVFPHMGYLPCWYLQRNSQRPIPMAILPVARSLHIGIIKFCRDCRVKEVALPAQ